MLPGNQLAKLCIQACGRQALVAAAIQHDAGVTAYLAHIVLRIVHEEFLVVRIGIVGRIGKPEILPDHDAVAVAGLVEFFVGSLPDPVAYHGEIHLLMISYGDVVVACGVTQVEFAEAPVSAQPGNAGAVNPGGQAPVFGGIAHLAEAGFEVEFVRNSAVLEHRHRSIIQIGFAITVGPPQAWVLHPDCLADAALFSCRELHGQLEGRISYLSLPQHFAGIGGGISKQRLHRYIRNAGFGQIKHSLYERIGYGDIPLRAEADIPPYAYVAPADGRDPVPAYGRVESGIIGPKHASVRGYALESVALGRSGSGRAVDQHLHLIISFAYYIRNIEARPGEGSVYPAEGLAVQAHLRLPVDAAEIEEDLPALRTFVRKGAAVDEV